MADDNARQRVSRFDTFLLIWLIVLTAIGVISILAGLVMFIRAIGGVTSINFGIPNVFQVQLPSVAIGAALMLVGLFIAVVPVAVFLMLGAKFLRFTNALAGMFLNWIR
jgi:hypothetical protein